MFTGVRSAGRERATDFLIACRDAQGDAESERDRGPGADEAGLAYVRSRTPFSRLGRAEDVAAAVAYMASEASYTSGANLMVDGGWMAY